MDGITDTGMTDTFGERVKDLMGKRGMTQSELARLCGISQAMVSKIRKGDRRPGRETMERIARALGTRVADLTCDETGYSARGRRARGSGDVGKLRETVRHSKQCSQRFAEAEALALRVFGGEEYVPLPFYTEHGAEHSLAVERFLEQIIWKNSLGELDGRHDFIPSAEEAMYLLSATWILDIGMWYGILDNEQPEDLQDAARVVKLRDEHEVRASRYIQDKWNAQDCSWSPAEKEHLANICLYHRGHYPLSTFEPSKVDGRYTQGEVRLGILAALLRLADACHVDKRRTPQKVMQLYISLGMPAEARVHWERADLIRDVRFDHEERQIVLKGHYPGKFEFGLGKFDVREVGEMICENVREVLRGVQQTLSAFSNTDFREVRHAPYGMHAIDYQQRRRCLHMWPYFLSRPISPTEAAAALAQMLLLSTQEGEESGDLGSQWRKEIHQIMDKTQSLRQQDFMIRNLCIGVAERLSQLPKGAKSAGKLKQYLIEFMQSIKKNCDRLAARARNLIGDNDVLVLYGHSVNIERLLRDIEKNHSVYIVDCYRPLGGYPVFNENKKVFETVKGLRFNNYKFLQLASLAGALDELKREKAPCKLLLGTHGRLKGGDMLCKVGSRMIANVAEQFGADIIAFCGTTKFLADGAAIDDEIAGPEQLFSSEDEKMHPELVDVPYVAPKMDRVPKRLVDMVVTEKGVERRQKRSSRVTGKGRAKGKKASRAK